MTSSSFPRVARWLAIVVVVAVAVPLAAQNRAGAWHGDIWVEPLLDRADYTLNVVGGEGYLAWTEAAVCCTTEMGYASSLEYLPAETVDSFSAMLRTPGGDELRLNRAGTWAMVGGIDRGVLAYAAGRSQTDIRLVDLRTLERLRLPRGVNTGDLEYDPSISGKWLLFGRIRPKPNDDIRDDTSVILTNLKTGRSRVLASGKNYRTYSYPGQVNGDWVTFTACKWNKYGPNCGVTRYRISTGRTSSPDLNGLCCNVDPHNTNGGDYPPGRGVTASAVTAEGHVFMAMAHYQNTSWCSYSEIWIWDGKDGLGPLFGTKEDEGSYDEPYVGLVVKSVYFDESNDPQRLLFDAHSTHEDHGYDCDIESSALYAMNRGIKPSPAPGSSPSPNGSPETPAPSPDPAETPTPSPTPSPTASSTPSPQPTPSPSCLLPVCV